MAAIERRTVASGVFVSFKFFSNWVTTSGVNFSGVKTERKIFSNHAKNFAISAQ
jgi:hypothetical protein